MPEDDLLRDVLVDAGFQHVCLKRWKFDDRHHFEHEVLVGIDVYLCEQFSHVFNVPVLSGHLQPPAAVADSHTFKFITKYMR